MRFVRPGVFLTTKSVPDRASGKSDCKRVAELVGRRCYLAFKPDNLNPDIQRIRSEIRGYCENVMRFEQRSAAKHASFTFLIEGISEFFIGEMHAYRADVGVRESNIRWHPYERHPGVYFVETPMLCLTEDESRDTQLAEYESRHSNEDISDLCSTAVKKRRTRELFKRAVEQDEINYREFREIWAEEIKPESKFKDKRYVISLGSRITPMGIATAGVWTMNISSLWHICTMHCSEAAEEEIAVVAGKVLEIMMREEPSLFCDFYMSGSLYWQPVYDKV